MCLCWKLLPQCLWVLHSHAGKIPWELGEISGDDSEGHHKMLCSYCFLFLACFWVHEKSIWIFSKTIAFTILDLSVFPWEYSWRNGSRRVSATVTLKLLHCSMPSFICLYLCSKSLLGFGGKLFVFLTLMYTYEKRPFLVIITLNLTNSKSKSTCKSNQGNVGIIL